MDKLFLTPAEFEKCAAYQAYHILPNDSTQWVKEIITQFLEEHPYLQNEPMTVTWKKMDKVKGYAVGSLNTLGLTIPVIVKEWKLAPLDVMLYAGGKAMPLTDSTLHALMTEVEPFKGIAQTRQKSNLSLFGDGMDELQYSPVDEGERGLPEGSRVRDAVKVGSVIDEITSFDTESVKSLFTTIQNDPQIKLGFEQNNTVEILEKIASKPRVSVNSTVEDFVRGLEVDRQLVYKDTYGNTFIKQANSNVDHVWEVQLSPEEAEGLQDKVAKCKKNHKKDKKKKKMVKSANAYNLFGKKEHFYINEDRNWCTFDENILKTASEAIEIDGEMPKIGETGVIRVKDTVIGPFEIIGIEKSAGFEEANVYKLSQSNGTIYINKAGDWMVDDKNTVKTASVYDPEGKNPVVGDYGAWVIGDHATVPFEIVKMTKIAEDGRWEINTFDGLRKVAYYPIRPNSDDLVKHPNKNSFYVPGNAKFVKLGKNMVKTGMLEQKIERNLAGAVEKGPIVIHAFDGLSKLSFFVTRENADEIVKHDTVTNGYYIPQSADFVKVADSLNVTLDVLPFEVQMHKVEKDDVGLYNLTGPEFKKYAERHEIRNLNAVDTKWALIHMGADSVEVASVDKMAKNATLKIASELKCPAKPADIVGKIAERYNSDVEKIAKLAVSLIKEASVLKDNDTVEAVLSLGLMSKYNLLDYLNVIPMYEGVMGELAKLLISVRMGMTSLPEEPVKNALDSVTDVVDIMKRIDSAIKR